jgi:hypothetical protein
MKRRRSHRRSQPAKAAEAPKTGALSGWRGRAITAAWVLVPFLSIFLVLLGILWLQWRTSLDQRLAAWKSTYGLSEDTVRELRRIELDFHGSGIIFTTPIARSPSEVLTHHDQMAAMVDEKLKDKFLHDLNTGRWNH